MQTDKVTQYIKLINEQLKPHSDEQEDDLVGSLDLIWYSMSESEMEKASAAAKILSNYYGDRK